MVVDKTGASTRGEELRRDVSIYELLSDGAVTAQVFMLLSGTGCFGVRSSSVIFTIDTVNKDVAEIISLGRRPVSTFIHIACIALDT